jgi:hypothetical protein
MSAWQFKPSVEVQLEFLKCLYVAMERMLTFTCYSKVNELGSRYELSLVAKQIRSLYHHS